MGYIACMGSVQRSFRLSTTTSELLDTMSELGNESRNSLVERLLAEALRTERHPMIRFRTGAAGRREPYVVGTRLLVRHLVPLVRAEGGVRETAESLGVEPHVVSAAVSYFASFPDEIEADMSWAARIESESHVQWMREQAVTA